MQKRDHEPAQQGVSDLRDPERRTSLQVQLKPYWEKLARGQYLGYYKGVRQASWHARRFVGNGRYAEVKLGWADDTGHDGRDALSYSDAMEKARLWFRQFEQQDAGGGAQRGTGTATATREAASASGLRPKKIDEVSDAWSVERPDLPLKYLGLFLRLEHAHYLHEQRLAHISRNLGVNIGDMHVLLALRRSGGTYTMRPTDLFRALLVTSGAMTKRIDRLASAGLVKRLSADDDRRSELVQLTSRGVKKAETGIALIDKTLSAIIGRSRLGETTIRQMEQRLQTLLDAMQEVDLPQLT